MIFNIYLRTGVEGTVAIRNDCWSHGKRALLCRVLTFKFLEGLVFGEGQEVGEHSKDSRQLFANEDKSVDISTAVMSVLGVPWLSSSLECQNFELLAMTRQEWKGFSKYLHVEVCRAAHLISLFCDERCKHTYKDKLIYCNSPNSVVVCGFFFVCVCVFLFFGFFFWTNPQGQVLCLSAEGRRWLVVV